MRIDPTIKEDLKRYLLEKLDEKKRIVTILSPYPLEADDIEEIKSKFEYLHHAHIENVIDKSLLAGFVIMFGTKMIDVSLKRKIGDIVETAKRI